MFSQQDGHFNLNDELLGFPSLGLTCTQRTNRNLEAEECVKLTKWAYLGPFTECG